MCAITRGEGGSNFGNFCASYCVDDPTLGVKDVQN